ncbi:reverse transcriptase [Gossypium australe]|uniref:Reverse transcriptase n=1 Tax=Gossypium australe TaxID=47621 RepID=A0A5B6WE46_9ROSI|nr:reverse transcriptase [Gossypium australe]
MDSNGNVYNSNEGLLSHPTSYFDYLFSSNGIANTDANLEGVETCITASMNVDLTRAFSYEEMCIALKNMSPLKASGEGGLGVVFCQRFWHIVGKEVASYCIEVSNPGSMSQFRPISLCNILYKIVAKMLVNRFQSILYFCIDETQSVFVLGRLIFYNILAAYEILYFMSKRRLGKLGSFALKLDISKTYDRVE